jgi:hypothetical protein
VGDGLFQKREQTCGRRLAVTAEKIVAVNETQRVTAAPTLAVMVEKFSHSGGIVKNGILVKRSVMVKLLLALFFLPISLIAQTFPVETESGKITYTEDILVKDASQSELYDRAKSWIITSNKNKQEILVEDAANGLLTSSNFMTLLICEGNRKNTWKLWYTVKIQVEDDRLWYSMSDFQLQRKRSPQVSASKEAQTRKQPLEAFIIPKNAFDKSLHDKAQESILSLIKDMKASLF